MKTWITDETGRKIRLADKQDTIVSVENVTLRPSKALQDRLVVSGAEGSDEDSEENSEEE